MLEKVEGNRRSGQPEAKAVDSIIATTAAELKIWKARLRTHHSVYVVAKSKPWFDGP